MTVETVVAVFYCHGCEEPIRVPIHQMRVERNAIHWVCELCGTMSRRFDRDVMESMQDWDVPGGTRISEREADRFVRGLRRLERHLGELTE